MSTIWMRTYSQWPNVWKVLCQASNVASAQKTQWSGTLSEIFFSWPPNKDLTETSYLSRPREIVPQECRVYLKLGVLVKALSPHTENLARATRVVQRDRRSDLHFNNLFQVFKLGFFYFQGYVLFGHLNICNWNKLKVNFIEMKL